MTALDKVMNLFANDSEFSGLKVRPPSPKAPTFKVGDKHQITGGKYKKYKYCTFVKWNDTYSDVCIDSTEYKPGTTCPMNTIHSKVKNCYLLPIQNDIIEMPCAEDLMVVEKLLPEHDLPLPEPVCIDGVEDLAQEGLCSPVPADHPHLANMSGSSLGYAPFDPPDGTLEIDNMGVEVDNITDVLPSMTEALELRKEVILLKGRVSVILRENEKLKTLYLEKMLE